MPARTEQMRSDELIERIRKGAPGAFEALYRAHVDQVHRQLSRLVGDDADIDDLVQTVFIKVHKYLDSWRGESQFSTWLHRIVVNVAMTHLKKRSRRRWWSFDSQDDHTEASAATATSGVVHLDGALYAKKWLEVIQKSLSDLNPNQRVAWTLYELEGLSLEDIAQVSNCSVNTVGSRLREARSKMNRSLEVYRKRDGSFLESRRAEG